MLPPFYILQDDVPLARRVQRVEPRSGYGTPKRQLPFDEMKIGQSFLVPHDRRNSVTTRCSQVSSRRGWNLVVRTVADGVRVWRLPADVGSTPEVE